jgi:hypothetical protein
MGLRLMGLPATARYPDVTIEHAGEVLDLTFSGEAGEHGMQVPLRLLGDVDEESAVLDLAAQLQGMGYAVTLRR